MYQVRLEGSGFAWKGTMRRPSLPDFNSSSDRVSITSALGTGGAGGERTGQVQSDSGIVFLPLTLMRKEADLSSRL